MEPSLDGDGEEVAEDANLRKKASFNGACELLRSSQDGIDMDPAFIDPAFWRQSYQISTLAIAPQNLPPQPQSQKDSVST